MIDVEPLFYVNLYPGGEYTLHESLQEARLHADKNFNSKLPFMHPIAVAVGVTEDDRP
jgi:hypothetical protein